MSVSTSALTQWLVFRLQAHDYALPIGEVAEVLRMVALTPVPESPVWLSGMANLRGRAIPVIDLRRRLGLPPEAPGLSTPIIVTHATGRPVGLIADSVSEVITLPADAFEPPDALAGPGRAVSWLAHAGERLILVLDLPRLTAGLPNADGPQ
ncbi:MAG: chemotaxis protein CheW [Chloroflexi bacterium]|nr:chemotaxis protein CheW [Chloroflexota bacterium]